MLGLLKMMPVTLVCLLITVHAAQGYKCFEGQVTYCGINADGGAVAPPGKNYYVEGQNWACTDPGSNMDPTFIAPNCWDQQSCSNLQTDPYDDAFNMSHQQPYDYVGNIAYIGELTNTSLSCPADVPACGLQTTLREAKHANGQHRDCEQCYTRFRYSADIGAIYWNVWQIQKKCVEPGTPCNNTACYCTVDAPYYQGELHIPDGNGGYTIQNGSQYCSVWAKSACRRKVFKCVFHLADYVVTTFQDYEIKFCSIGPDTPECSGCVACKHDDCLYPVIHASKAIDPKTDYKNASNYNCSMELCGEAPRTCWNETCIYTDDCWPKCDPTLFHKRIGWANMGFYVPASGARVLIEEVFSRCNG
ncbi:hypothetical protein GUITHDRAFT_165177 [Guillardia theta CCMP2712]|uniref:Uncharacterized protein n=1 Tax=Guillardia theta (strain CCMP2712) TaxID=905079 RepID=L1IQI6_GUITC|nr:hypothetical protein GUITHDRAFT_165177 [Guillardia theta CCMP2712]EKX38518.1 hypothetical protein GUITHDRAFT_165177 [Guillardia theta CCMP2712]|eukprot:XP_005825498.1 hypothetical protein GUITHDRAFT_165177 [Guillardia theta CCMP2712]